jgi:hypothetical protein
MAIEIVDLNQENSFLLGKFHFSVLNVYRLRLPSGNLLDSDSYGFSTGFFMGYEWDK